MTIQDFTLGFRESRLAWASESDSSAGLAGAGTTGDSAGMGLGSCSTMAPGCLTAGLSIAASITDFTPADFMEPVDFTAAGFVALILERSAASIVEGLPEASRLAAGRASLEDFIVADFMVEASEVFTEAEAVAGNSARLLPTDFRLLHTD